MTPGREKIWDVVAELLDLALVDFEVEDLIQAATSNEGLRAYIMQAHHKELSTSAAEAILTAVRNNAQ